MTDLKWYGDKVEKAIREAAMQAIHTGAEAILTESMDEVPHATGTLMRSGTVTDAPTEHAAYVSYNTPYAIKMHEDVSLRHPDPTNSISSSGRKAKYLEDPFNRLKGKVQNMAADAIRRVLQGTR